MGLFKCLGFRVEKDRSERDLMRPTPFFVGQFDPLVCQDDLVLVGRNESLFVLEELHTVKTPILVLSVALATLRSTA